MTARDLHHTAVRRALVRDGWTIIHHPLTLTIGTNNLFTVPEHAFATVFASDLGRVLNEDYKLVLLVFDPKQEVIVRWQR